MKRFRDLIAEARARVREIMPWDLVAQLAAAINVPRGVLETACEPDYQNTVPTLAEGRSRPIVIVCRSGNRSVLAADVMQQLGFNNVVSLRTGVRGWSEYDQPLFDIQGNAVEGEAADQLLNGAPS